MVKAIRHSQMRFSTPTALRLRGPAAMLFAACLHGSLPVYKLELG